MPQISPTELCALPLLVHTLLADVPLHDVWAVDLPAHRDGVTFLTNSSLYNRNRIDPGKRAQIEDAS
jgi:hypothetical protein